MAPRKSRTWLGVTAEAVSVAFALEQDLERDERVNFKDTVAIDPAVTRATGHRHLLEPTLAQEPLTDALETSGGQRRADRSAARSSNQPRPLP
jgi:hypothetical protein